MFGIYNKTRCTECGNEGYMGVNDTLNDTTVCDGCGKAFCYSCLKVLNRAGKSFCASCEAEKKE